MTTHALSRIPQLRTRAATRLVVFLHGGEEPAGGQRQDRRLGRLRVQGLPEGPGQQVGAGGQLDLIAGVIHAEVSTGRVVYDLQRVHPVADAVPDAVAVSGGGGDRADDRGQGQAGGHGAATIHVSAADRGRPGRRSASLPDGSGNVPQDGKRGGASGCVAGGEVW